MAITPRLSGKPYAFAKLTGFDWQRIPLFQNRMVLKKGISCSVIWDWALVHFLKRHLVFAAFTHIP